MIKKKLFQLIYRIQSIRAKDRSSFSSMIERAQPILREAIKNLERPREAWTKRGSKVPKDIEIAFIGTRFPCYSSDYTIPYTNTLRRYKIWPK